MSMPVLFSGRTGGKLHRLRERQGSAAVALCGKRVDEHPLFRSEDRHGPGNICKRCTAKINDT